MKALFDYSEGDIAKRFSRSREWVRDRLSLALSLAPQVEEYVGNRLLTSTHAIRLCVLSKDDQTQVADVIVEKEKAGAKISTRVTEGVVHAIQKADTAELKQQILEKPWEAYAHTFKDPKQLEQALLTIGPQDDFIEKTREIKTQEQAKELFDDALDKKAEPITNDRCPGCGKTLRIDWVKREVSWA